MIETPEVDGQLLQSVYALISRAVLDGLLGAELQSEWDDVEYVLKGTGRVALTSADRDHLGDLALKIPLLG
jgi:hypothetical protein